MNITTENSISGSGGESVNKSSIIQQYANGAAPPTPVDLAQSLLAGKGSKGIPRRFGLLVKNLNMSGGNRVILNLFDQLQDSKDTEIHVFVVPEVKRHIGEVLDLIRCKRRYGAAASVTRARQPINPQDFDTIISTSRRTLDFVTDLAHPGHVHLLQAIEAWDSENSTPFLEYCRDRRYPAPDECIDLIRQIGLPQDVRYVEQIASVRRVLTVSSYLDSAIRYAGQAEQVVVCEPELNIRGSGGHTDRGIDVLLFVRGDPYNGDELSIAIANALADKPYRIAIVAGRRAKAQIKAIQKRDRISLVYEPSDAVLAGLFASARVVVHPSLCNGGGFIPFEALSFGCAVVASRTGWLLSAESKGPLTVVDRHDPDIYLAKVLGVLASEVSRSSRQTTSPPGSSGV